MCCLVNSFLFVWMREIVTHFFTVHIVFLFVCPAVTPSAQLLEQTARLQSLSDTLGRLKVTRH